jgi:hypothetical protein
MHNNSIIKNNFLLKKNLKISLLVDYEEDLKDIKGKIKAAQQESLWEISVDEQLAKDLQNAFPRMQGFLAHNLWGMRDSYLSYYQNS